MYWLLISLLFLNGCASTSKSKERAAIHLQLGTSLYESGNYPQAISELTKAEQLDPNNAAVHNNLGLVYWARQKLELAEKHMERAVALSPSFTDARNNLVRIYTELKKFSKAEKEMNKVLADLTYPALDKAYYNRGVLYFEQGRMVDAEKAFRSSLDAQKENCYAMTYLGRTYFERKQYEQAASIFDRGIGLCRKALFDEPHYYSALTYFRLGQREKSEARFEEIIKSYPDGKYVEKSRAMLHLMRKN
ncbi:MAG: tetratricopeptide repeat protein, partial [Bdellovibrionota bacterium]